MQTIIGYHGTKTKNVESILKDGFKISPFKKGDNHWLGHGIYFYADYELADWWAQTKVNIHNSKYNHNDTPSILKSKIEADLILDLDNPFLMKKFIKYQEKLEKEYIEQGIVLDFSKGMGERRERIRCFWMDIIKEEYNIQVIIYTFTRKNPSYANSKHHAHSDDKYSLANMGLDYHEKQICVTKNEFIIDTSEVIQNIKEFDEVII